MPRWSSREHRAPKGAQADECDASYKHVPPPEGERRNLEVGERE